MLLSLNTASMNFILKDIQESIVGVARSLGYQIIDTNPNGEYNLVRKFRRVFFYKFNILEVNFFKKIEAAFFNTYSIKITASFYFVKLGLSV